MIKVTNLKEIDQIQPLMLKAYIAKKMTAMMQEYQVDNLDDIGCFIVLEPEEFTDFPIGEAVSYTHLDVYKRQISKT